MRLVRCKSCRTVCDGDRFHRCIGCSTLLADALPVARGASRAALQGDRDQNSSRRVLWILTGIFLVSIPIAGIPLALAPALAAFLLLASLTSSWSFRMVQSSELSSVGRVLMYMICLFLAVCGSFVLVMVACSAPLSHLD